MNRRDFIKQISLTLMGLAATGAKQRANAEERKSPTMPTIQLGKVKVSRLILGSNPFYGFSHQTDALSKEMMEYYTDERIVAVLDEAAKQGITAIASPPYERWIKLFNSYLERGGKLRIWIAQPDGPPDRMIADINAAVQGGAKAVFVQGMRVDEQFQKGTFDVVRKWVEHIKSLGVPAGIASHRPDVHLEAEKLGFPTDFYFQCFYNPTQGFRDEDRLKAVETIRQISKPVVAYKILGAGRLPAREGFEFALRHIREKDGICVGIFPKHHPRQIEEDVALVRELSQRH